MTVTTIDTDELAQIVADAIAEGIRERDTRAPASTHQSLTLSTGTIVQASGSTALVQLDEDDPGVYAAVQLASAVTIGNRVKVLGTPNGGGVVVGNGGSPGSTTPGVDDYDIAFGL